MCKHLITPISDIFHHCIFICNFNSNHHLFLIYNYLQQSYAKFPPLFSFLLILINGDLIETQIVITMIIIPP